MVGRQDLLDELDRWRSETTHGKSIVLHIIGEPGLGKSKLLREWIMASESTGHMFGWFSHTCHGVPYGGYPLRAWRRLFPRLNQNEPASPATRSLTTVLEYLNVQRPSLVIVDDLHWVDAESLALITDLIALSTDLPVMFVLAYRPSFMDRAPSHPERLHRRLSLQRLGQDEISVLIAALADKMAIVVSPSFTNQVLAKAAGIPLYPEEALAHLSAVLRSGNTDAIELPPSLLDLLVLRVRWTAERTLPELERHRREWSFGLLGRHSASANPEILRDIEGLEEQLSSWLDRLDVVDDERHVPIVEQFLTGLQRIDQELALLSLLVGSQRPHRNRLAQSLTRIAHLNRCHSGLE